MTLQDISRALNIFLRLDRNIVGVKFVYSKEEFDTYEGRELCRPLAYCVCVKSAAAGHSLKLSRDMGGCNGSNRALGFVACGDDFWRGASGCRLGLYESEAVAAEVAGALPICEPNTYGVVVKPLPAFEANPDVLLIFSNPREAMRILQGYTYVYGLTKGLNMSGNQAVCVEATVTPFFTGELNVSMLCSGTRYHAGWKDGEVLSGIPMKKAEGLIRGLKKTVNPVELNDRKKEIEDALRASDALDFVVDYEKTYFKRWKASE